MNSGKKSVCVIVPIYQEKLSQFETISLESILNVFDTRSICFVHPQNFNRASINRFIQPNVFFESFEDCFFLNTKSYNRLLMSEDFYSRFSNFNYILIAQLDVYAIKDDLDFWMELGYDNIGAPIFNGYSKPTNEIKEIGANGGFCLRKVESCLRVLNNLNFVISDLSNLWDLEQSFKMKIFRVLRDGLLYNYKCKFLKPLINEDIFWSVIVKKQFTWFKTCKPMKAAHFAFDANPRFLYNLCEQKKPMAVHAWWRYDLAFMQKYILPEEVNLK